MSVLDFLIGWSTSTDKRRDSRRMRILDGARLRSPVGGKAIAREKRGIANVEEKRNVW